LFVYKTEVEIMNKVLVSLAASLAVLGVVFAQVPGNFQEAPRPGQVP
jgi:hypothetical protein